MDLFDKSCISRAAQLLDVLRHPPSLLAFKRQSPSSALARAEQRAAVAQCQSSNRGGPLPRPKSREGTSTDSTFLL